MGKSKKKTSKRNPTCNNTVNIQLDSYERSQSIANKEVLCDTERKELNDEKIIKIHKKSDTSESINKVVTEIEQDLFKLSQVISLACCVAEDFKMESEVSLQFKRTFGDVNELLEQKLKMGEVGLVHCQNQYAFYLVLKKCSNSKSKMGTITKAFKNLIIKMKELDLTELAIAKTDFELVGHSWNDIKKNVTDLFAESGIHILVCVPSKELELIQSKDSSNSNKNIHEFEVSGSANELSDQMDNMKCDKNKKKKKEKAIKDQHKNILNSDKSTEFDLNLQKTSSTKSKSVKHEHLQFTDDNNKSQEFNKEKFEKKSQNNKKYIKNKKSFDDGCQVNSEEDKCLLNEIDLDIFELSEEFSIAHCVAEDLRMGAGIAVEFKRRFGGVGKLVDQNLKVGSVGVIKHYKQNVFYLVTKTYSTGKPTMLTLEMALRSLLKMMKDRNLKKLGIPKIGCGLDGLDWDSVRLLIMQIFSESDIEITVCVPSKILEHTMPLPSRVFITPKNLWEMELKTTIIMFINVDQVKNQNWCDSIIDEVNSRYPFKENLLKDVMKTDLHPGVVKMYRVNSEYLFCVFFRQSEYYSSLETAFKTILNLVKDYQYLAIQSGSIVDNFKHISWIELILRSISSNQQAELWLCGDTKQTDDSVRYDQYCKQLRYSFDHLSSRVIYRSNNILNSSSKEEYSRRSSRHRPTFSNKFNKAGSSSPKEKQMLQNSTSEKQWQKHFNETDLISFKDKTMCSDNKSKSSNEALPEEKQRR